MTALETKKKPESSEMKPITSVLITLLFGMFLGGAMTAGIFFYRNRRTTVLTAREAIALQDGIMLPKGTQLVHHTSMSEGFETLRLYVNVSSDDLERYFDRRQESRAFLVIPYWVQ